MTRIYIAGHNGMVGGALNRLLTKRKGSEIITASRRELDLTNQEAVQSFFRLNTIDQVYLAAAKVGGISANNTYPADFIYENLMIQSNIIQASFQAGVKKLLFLGSSCIYPRLATQPMAETELFNGKLEATNEPYAIAKIAGIKLCESYNRQYGETHGIDYRSVMPTNLYGPGDNYHLENSHVIPGLIRRINDAKEGKARSVTVWGSGRPLREFMHVDDLAAASAFVMDQSAEIYWRDRDKACSHINVGSGCEVSIEELAHLIKKIIGYEGELKFDPTKPDGTPRKLLNSQKLKSLGWVPKISLEAGIRATYNEYRKQSLDIMQAPN